MCEWAFSPRLLPLLLLLLLASLAYPAPAPTLSATIRALIAHNPVAATAYWGIEIADVSTGATIFRLNHDNFFVPASNTKLFSTALTLSHLGSRFRIETTLQSQQPPDPDGLLSCDLILKGAGDPSLKTADLEALADQLFEHGIRRIDGNILGDDTLFLWEPYNPGWSIDDAVEGYGAPISALTLNDNELILHLTPTGTTFEPSVPLLMIENQLQTDEMVPARIHYDRLPGSPNLRLWGSTHADTKDPEIHLGVDDPARYAALVLFDALQRRGIQVMGKAAALHRLAGQKFDTPAGAPIILARHESLPLLEDLRVTEKTSQNLHAETYLRLVASQKLGQGSREVGLDELHAFLEEARIDQKQYRIRDGSGLSRLNVVTPHSIVALLTYMAKSSNDEDFTTMLAVGGIDGTLENRMKTKRMKGRILAKTGSLTHVTALSGYVMRRNGRRYAFSILVNNYNGPASDIRTVIDKICNVLVD
jgi:D-alanyl-D-alanine carboxypeptidase/D-alanyl-D-alanine-endopeptidase (penicillin-binding protein 4)